ncbi:MAG: hypothetical protein ACD_86C00004G0002 [uncultured bacterium]|nr:MAG: hypothetical protein ACD_86C00004G0002 [uncultured bacterium]
MANINEFDINEFDRTEWDRRTPSVDTSLPFAGANRVIQGSKERGSNLNVTISPTGTTEISNILKPSQSEAIPKTVLGVPGSIEGAAPKPDDMLAALRTRQAEIMATQDTGTRFNQIASLAGAVEGFIATKAQAAQKQAEQETGLSELKASLEESIRLDRDTPEFVKLAGGSDSSETLAARQQYQSALIASQGIAQKYLLTDPEAAAVQGEFDSFIKIQSQLTANEYQTQAKLKEYGENIQKVANYVSGGEASPDLVIKNIAHYAKLAEIAEDPAMLVQATLLGKDPAIGTLLAHKQAEKLSGTSDMNSPIFKQVLQEAQTELKVMKGIQTDTAMFDKAVKDLNIPEAQRGELDMLKRDNSVAGQRAYAEAKGSIALAYIRQNTKNKFLGDVDSWITTTENGTRISPFGNSDTALGRAYAEVKKVTPTVSVQSLVGAFKNLSPADRPVAETHLKELMRNAKDHASTGYFGQFADNLSIEMEVNQKIVQSLFPEGSFAAVVAKKVGEYNARPPLLGSPFKTLFGDKE